MMKTRNYILVPADKTKDLPATLSNARLWFISPSGELNEMADLKSAIAAETMLLVEVVSDGAKDLASSSALAASNEGFSDVGGHVFGDAKDPWPKPPPVPRRETGETFSAYALRVRKAVAEAGPGKGLK